MGLQKSKSTYGPSPIGKSTGRIAAKQKEFNDAKRNILGCDTNMLNA